MAVALALWTLVVWLGRIRNVADDGLDALVLPAAMTALAVAALLDRRAVVPLAVANIGVWGVRLPLVLAHDHPAAFKVVHAVLAAVSIALAGAALRSARRRATASAVAGVEG